MAAVVPQHRIQVDVVGDRLAHRVAETDGARVVHPAPDARVVSVRSRLRDAGVRAIQPSCRRQCERLAIGEMSDFDSLHADARWPLLLRRMNLPVDSERDAAVK